MLIMSKFLSLIQTSLSRILDSAKYPTAYLASHSDDSQTSQTRPVPDGTEPSPPCGVPIIWSGSFLLQLLRPRTLEPSPTLLFRHGPHRNYRKSCCVNSRTHVDSDHLSPSLTPSLVQALSFPYECCYAFLSGLSTSGLAC